MPIYESNPHLPEVDGQLDYTKFNKMFRKRMAKSLLIPPVGYITAATIAKASLDNLKIYQKYKNEDFDNSSK
jgi:hypothetical protein